MSDGSDSTADVAAALQQAGQAQFWLMLLAAAVKAAGGEVRISHQQIGEAAIGRVVREDAEDGVVLRYIDGREEPT